MSANTYYLELINKTMKTENLFLKKKGRRYQKKNLAVNLLELIQVMRKRVLIQTMNLVKYKYLSVILKKKEKKELEGKIKKIKLRLANQSV